LNASGAWLIGRETANRVSRDDLLQLIHAARATAAAAPVAQPLTPLTAEQVAQLIVDTGYNSINSMARADFINGIRHGERAHGITAAPQPPNAPPAA
jgi:hypothetical protein